MSIAEDTVFVFLDEHLPLAAALEAEYPDAVKIGKGVEQGRALYVAYLVPAHPQSRTPAGTLTLTLSLKGKGTF